MIAYLGSADPDCQFQFIMIHIILLPEDNFLKTVFLKWLMVNELIIQ
jgi:hypothetical protein